MEPATALAIVGSAIGGAKVVEKILGPTAELLGQGLRGNVERACNNIGRIFTHAQAKLGDRIEEPGGVPPKVVRDIYYEGSFCEDPLAAEYFGGVLASSRTEISRDDRGSTFTSLIARLSTYQLRSHFVFYRLVKKHFDGAGLSVSRVDDVEKMRLYLPIASFDGSMGFAGLEDARAILAHAMFGLQREALIHRRFEFGVTFMPGAQWGHLKQPGIAFSPSSLGAELFLWAHGQGAIPPYEFLDLKVKFAADTAVPSITDAQAMHPTQAE